MESIVAVFNNRNQAMQFASYLKRLGVRSKTISTPRELSVSCGISVVFSSKSLGQAKILIDRYGFRPNIKLFITSGDLFVKYHQIF